MQNTSYKKQYSKRWYVFTTCIILLILLFVWNLVTTFYPLPPLTVSDGVDVSTTVDLANTLEQQMQRWQAGLFLESYAVTYRLPDENVSAPVLIGEAYFRFAGYREDWLGKLVGLYNANHVIASLNVDIRQRKVLNFSYQHGEPFGFDAPINIASWPVSERELLRFCGEYGGDNFQDTFHVEFVHVNTDATRPGRYWNASYNAAPRYFECLVNLDSGEILVQDEQSDWQNVGNLHRGQ